MEINAQQSAKAAKFSIGLGLFDYINPILYAITSTTITIHMRGVMLPAIFVIFVIGTVISLIFGLAIPTVKLIVGLGLMQFKMPVNLVFFVNSGIFLSGLMLFYTTFSLSLSVLLGMATVLLCLLGLIYHKNRRFNTVAVLTGAFGYAMIYAGMIAYSLKNSLISSVILYAAAIFLFVFLCLIGIKANLKDARVHWVIEISNVLCQLCVAVATLMAF